MFVVKRSEFEPAYFRLFETGELGQRVERALGALVPSERLCIYFRFQNHASQICAES